MYLFDGNQNSSNTTPPRRRRQPQQQPNSQPAATRSPEQSRRTSKFPKASKEPSYKHQIDGRRQATASARRAEFLQEPPTHEDLREVRLVIPGKHRLPLALDNPSAFDHIRTGCSVWITRPEPNIYDIYSRSMVGLQEAMEEIHSTLHNMRLSNDVPLVRYFVQDPIWAAGDALAKFKPNSRIEIAGMDTQEQPDLEPVVASYVERVVPGLRPATASLMAIDKHLTMRVQFGKLWIESVKKGTSKQLGYPELREKLNAYSTRGGATMKKNFASGDTPKQLVRHFLKPEIGVCSHIEGVRRSCSLTIATQSLELTANILGLDQAKPHISGAKLMRSEDWSRLNWSMVAPDMRFDWSVEVNASEEENNIPSNLQTMLRLAQVKRNNVGAPDTHTQIPDISLHKLESSGPAVDAVRLQSSITIPFKSTPYLIEVSIVKTYPKGKMTDNPSESWGIKVYGAHWDEAINCVSAEHASRKDWGDDLRNMWMGRDRTLEQRYGDFVRDMLEIHVVLDRFDPNGNRA